jgi:hypothetical protein
VAIAVVSSVSAGSTAGATVTTGSIDTSGASLLVAVVSDYCGAGVNASTVTDSKSNTWTPLTEGVDTTDVTRCRISYAINPTVGSGHTFSTANGDLAYPTICVIAVSGAATSTPFDVQNIDGDNNVSAINHTAGVTPTTDGQIVIAGVCLGTTSAASIDGGFTLLESEAFDDSDHFAGALAYLIQTTATAANPTWTFTGSAAYAASAIATFKAAAGGGGSPWYYFSQQ